MSSKMVFLTNDDAPGNVTWPSSGDVIARTWSPDLTLEHGLFGLPWGCVPYGCVVTPETWWSNRGQRVWTVGEADTDTVLEVSGFVKVPRAVVVFQGNLREAVAYLEHRGEAEGDVFWKDNCWNVVRDAVVAGEGGIAVARHGTVKSGWGGIAAAFRDSNATVGSGGTAVVGSGGVAVSSMDGIAVSRCRGKSEAGVRGIAVTGDQGQAKASTDGVAVVGSWGSASVGAKGVAIGGKECFVSAGFQGVALGGYRSVVSAGEGGVIAVQYRDRSGRLRLAVGYVGEDGIEADRPYRFDNGAFVRHLSGAPPTRDKKV